MLDYIENNIIFFKERGIIMSKISIDMDQLISLQQTGKIDSDIVDKMRELDKKLNSGELDKERDEEEVEIVL